MRVLRAKVTNDVDTYLASHPNAIAAYNLSTQLQSAVKKRKGQDVVDSMFAVLGVCILRSDNGIKVGAVGFDMMR